MQVHAQTSKVLFTKGTAHGWDTVQVKSKSNPSRSYTVDMTHGRCSCPAWIHTKPGSDGARDPCKHLKALGFKRVITMPDFAEPKKVQGDKQKVTA